MFLTKITFGSDKGKKRQREALSDKSETYLAALLKNGQIYGDYIFSWFNGCLVAYSHIARPDALEKKHHAQWSLPKLNSVVKSFGQSPKWEIIDDSLPKRFRSWQRSKSLYLSTDGFDYRSPLCCGDTGLSIPPYLIPISDRIREDLYFWAEHYRDHDKVWLASATLEIPAYKQMADPKSNLSVSGREICVEIERVTGKPTFYYLKRYWGRKVGESTRSCPLCGDQWTASDDEGEKHPFHKFHFRCEQCRLVSHIADSYDDERHARIGEFKR